MKDGLYGLIELAAEKLPEGSSISIEIENGWAGVVAIGADGQCREVFDNDGNDTCLLDWFRDALVSQGISLEDINRAEGSKT